MSGKNVNFGDKKIKKVTFTKEEPYPKKSHLNTLLDTMIMVLLNHYA